MMTSSDVVDEQNTSERQICCTVIGEYQFFQKDMNSATIEPNELHRSINVINKVTVHEFYCIVVVLYLMKLFTRH